jgi:hypothetical protein
VASPPPPTPLMPPPTPAYQPATPQPLVAPATPMVSNHQYSRIPDGPPPTPNPQLTNDATALPGAQQRKVCDSDFEYPVVLKYYK